MNKYAKTLVVFSIFLLPLFGQAACQNSLTRTIKPGMKGNDVKTLQKYLNENTDTQISKTGVNSKGRENGIYDAATQKAFRAFQTKNADIILKPAGLKKPNGVVGTGSRSLINKNICAKQNVPQITNMTDSEANAQIKLYEKRINDSLSKLNAMKIDLKNRKTTNSQSNLANIENKLNTFKSNGVSADEFARFASDQLNKSHPQGKTVILQGISPDIIKQGSKIYLFGDNFAKENKVYIGDRLFMVNMAKVGDRFVSVEIPKDFSPKQYDVYFENINGRSNKLSIAIGGSVLNIKSPQITSITPTIGNIGTEVVVTGTGFTKNNTILTTTNIFKNVVSNDSKTLKFIIQADKGLLGIDGKLMKTLPFNVIIRNENGDSNVVDFKLN